MEFGNLPSEALDIRKLVDHVTEVAEKEVNIRV